jgi:hypothetical protein
MDESLLPLPSDLWAIDPVPAQVPLLEQFAALPAENQAPLARIRDLEEKVDQYSPNSSRPSSSDRFGSESAAGSRLAARLLTVVAS